MEEKVKVVLLGNDASLLKNVSDRINSTRPAHVIFYLSIKDFLEHCIANKPDLVGVSVSFPHKSAGHFPKVFKMALKIPILTFGENQQLKTRKLLSASTADLKITGVITAHNLWMKIVNFQKLKNNGASEGGKGSDDKKDSNGLGGEATVLKGGNENKEEASSGSLLNNLFAALDNPESVEDSKNLNVSSETGSKDPEDSSLKSSSNDPKTTSVGGGESPSSSPSDSQSVISSSESTSKTPVEKAEVGLDSFLANGDSFEDPSSMSGRDSQGSSIALSSSKPDQETGAQEDEPKKKKAFFEPTSSERKKGKEGQKSKEEEEEEARRKEKEADDAYRKRKEEERRRKALPYQLEESASEEESQKEKKKKNQQNSSSGQEKNKQEQRQQQNQSSNQSQKDSQQEKKDNKKAGDAQTNRSQDQTQSNEKDRGLKANSNKKENSGDAKGPEKDKKKQDSQSGEKSQKESPVLEQEDENKKKGASSQSSTSKKRDIETEEEKKSVLEECCDAALRETYSSQKDEEQTPFNAKKMTVYIVESGSFKGYLVLAESRETQGEGFAKSFQEKVQEKLKEVGASYDLSIPYWVTLEVDDYPETVSKFSDFSIDHKDSNGHQQNVSFVKREAVRPVFQDSDKEDMYNVDIKVIPPQTPVNFDAYLYLPINQKFVRYLKQGRSLSLKQAKRHSEEEENGKLYLPKDQKDQLISFFIQNTLNWEFTLHKEEEKKAS